MTRFGRVSLAVYVLAVLLVPAAPAVAHGPHAIKVMTRNQYLGADLTPVILAQTPEDFVAAATAALTQVAANNFPRRVRGFAREVFLTRPDVIGLQEVFDFTINGAHASPPFVDHLTATLHALEAAGLHYVVAGAITHLDVTLPIDVVGDPAPELVRVRDRDVILVRTGLPFGSLAGNAPAGLCGVPVPNPTSFGPPDLQSLAWEDGCTYTVVAQVGSPTGPIVVKRGFLGVDVTVAGKAYRVVNTHLEVRQPDPTNPASAISQFLQAVELAGTLAVTTPSDLTLIALGDFNSSPADGPIEMIPPSYDVLVGSGLEDAWLSNALAFLNPNGYTCCQAPDLTNTSSLLSERIDLVLVRDAGWFEPAAVVTGRVPLLPIATPPRWASDHAGVFATLFFWP